MKKIRRVMENEIEALSALATEIVREHFDPLIGTAQNDYMLSRFQTVEAIREQFLSGYRYYWVLLEEEVSGFYAIYPREGKMYLSKFYVRKDKRGNHLAQFMMDAIVKETLEEGLSSVYLNVNRGNDDVIAIYKHLGFYKLREEKNDIGCGFYMDDYVLQLDIKGEKDA